MTGASTRKEILAQNLRTWYTPNRNPMAQNPVKASVVLDRSTHRAAKQAAQKQRLSLSRFIANLVTAELNGNVPNRAQVKGDS